MRDYRLYSLDKETFQNLVYHICKIILGDGTINFSEGPDGGRDAKFVGRAISFPSTSKPWSGKFIIQAKGCKHPEGSCSQPDFIRQIKDEIKKVKKLVKNGEVDNYLVFTNRKLSANTEAKISKKIKSETKVKNACICGREWLTEEITKNPDIINICNLEKFISPLRIMPQDMKILINSFVKCRKEIGKEITVVEKKRSFLGKKLKNKINKLSKDYFEFMKRDSLPYFNEIDFFLENPINKAAKDSYKNLAQEIQSKITTKREEYNKFEEIFDHIYDVLLAKCPELYNNRLLIYVFLHYMYWNCDLGRTK